jgi:4a-hydroxytetrahydrobiopterin dehydratase
MTKVKLTTAEALAQLDGWKAVQDREAICKQFKFRNFSEAWAFMTRCALLAETMDHHPEWFNVYNRVDVTLTTHDVGGVSSLDVAMARKMDEMA